MKKYKSLKLILIMVFVTMIFLTTPNAIYVSKNPTECTSSTWTNCQNAYVDDTNYAEIADGAVGDVAYWAGFGFSIPAGVTINSVDINIKYYQAQIQWEAAVNTYNGSEWDTQQALADQQTECTYVGQNFTTAFTWTPEMVNSYLNTSANITTTGGPNPRWYRVCYINISVDYSPPPAGSLNVTLLMPDRSPINVTQNELLNVTANITCSGGSCGNVNGTIFYNATSNVYPDTELPGSTASTPFYNFTNLVNISCGSMSAGSQCLVSWLVNATGNVGSEWLMNVTAKSDDGTVVENSTLPNFQVNIVKPRLNMTLFIPDADMNIVDWYNFTINGTVTCVGGGKCGNVQIAARYNTTGTANPDLQIPSSGSAIITEDTNPYSCPTTLWSGQSCNYKWVINISASGSWVVDVNASTNNPNVTDMTNDSLNKIITAPPGLLNISNFTAGPINVENGNTFEVNATVNCVNGLCFNITASARYNSSTPDTPDTEIPTSGSPLYVDPNPRYCNYGGNNTVNGSGCIVTFTITTVTNGNYSIDINFTSTDLPVLENDSDNATIRVYTPAVVMAFTITFPGESLANRSSPTFPGNITNDIWFNGTGSFSKYIEPCAADPSTGDPNPTYCQDKASDIPMLLFKNIGNIPINITISLNESLPSSLILFANFSYPDGSGDYGGTAWCSDATLAPNNTVIGTTQLNFTKALCRNNETKVFLFANFSYVMAGEMYNTINYTSHNI